MTSQDQKQDPGEHGNSPADDATPGTSGGKEVRSQKDAPVGGSRVTEAQLTAHNEAEEDMLRAIDGESASG